jgi:hypothetical protein
MISRKVGNFFVKRPLLARSRPSMGPIRRSGAVRDVAMLLGLSISQVSYVRAPLAGLLQWLHRLQKPKPCQRAATKTASPQKPPFLGDWSRMGEGKPKKSVSPRPPHPNILQISPWISQILPTTLPEPIPIHIDPIVLRLLSLSCLSSGGDRCRWKTERRRIRLEEELRCREGADLVLRPRI